MLPLAETSSRFKPVSQFYNADDGSSSTETDDLDTMQNGAELSNAWSESSDSDEVCTGREKRVAFGKLVTRKEMSITQNQVFETSYVQKEQGQTFKTLAQLIDPRASERIKCCTKRRKALLARKIRARKNYRFHSRPLAKCRRSLNPVVEAGRISLIVDLIFQKDNLDGLSSSNSTLFDGLIVKVPEDGLSTKISSQGSVNQEKPTSQDEEEEQCNLVSVRDPNSVSASRKCVASAFLPSTQLKWREVDVGNADPLFLVNRTCKIFNALENKWFKVSVCEYNHQTKKHRIIFSEGEKWQLLCKDRLALYISLHDKLKLISGDGSHFTSCERKTLTEDLLVLAANVEDFDADFGHGDIVWAEVSGYPFWPAFVMDEEHAKLRGSEMNTVPGTLPVQFFGSHECARVNSKRVVGFSKGLRRDYHLKCRRMLFDRGLEELDKYSKEGELPPDMLHLQEEPLATPVESNQGKESEAEDKENDEDFVGDERKHKVRKSLDSIFKCPIKLGSLEILSLGKIVKDSEYFHDQHYIWTEGYTASRRFFSTRDPTRMVTYKMEILKNPIVRTMPLFRVTPEDGEQVDGASAAVCWKRIFDKLQKAKGKLMPNTSPGDKRRQFYRSGAAMFGLSHPRVSRLIQALPYARVCSKFKAWVESTPLEDVDLLPAGFKHVEADWKHLDRCSVCYTNEEYEGNVLLQCDKCRMLVHLNCYGVLEAPGDSWLCNLCDQNAPKSSPPCCLCPIQGGAMKRTTDGRWVHLACALWIPETCCVDMDRMEPIDGIQTINKERWKLTCTICNVPYGACIQCADHHCRVAYHPLCARAAGFCTKVLEGLRRKRNRDTGAQEEERSVQLLSYCKKHMQSGKNSSAKSTRNSICRSDDLSYTFHNQSGCARSEPYNAASRRGRREPEQYTAAVAKRGFLENRPYIVTGGLRRPCKRKGSLLSGERPHPFLTIRRSLLVDDNQVALSTSERFNQMRSSLHQRLTFGKSAIHGWGLFAKLPHDAGDMVIEYAGEVIRPVVADVREKSCYNSLVGAGTYMFCIDNERVVDATRSGSIAHLINHSCEPNCYSRVVAANGKERIIIFAKQDIAGGEEVTYDYRFTSIGEQLACHCGSAGCRGIVNVMDEEDESGRILANAAEITRWL